MTSSSDSMGLAGLAGRCEAAGGADRELDAAIWVRLPEQAKRHHSGGLDADAQQIAGCSFIPAYTASVDAATKLVREDLDWSAGSQPDVGDGKRGWACLSPCQTLYVAAQEVLGSAATPALALCAAALRALAHQEQSA